MIIGGVAWYAASRGSGATAEVIPPGVTGQTTVQAAAHQVPNTSGISGISGVTEYVTTGWPAASHNGRPPWRWPTTTSPGRSPTGHPAGGRPAQRDMGELRDLRPAGAQRARGTQPGARCGLDHLPAVAAAIGGEPAAGVRGQADQVPSAEGAASRYMDLSPYLGLPSPIVLSSWGFQLKVSSAADPRLQQFVNKFRASPTYTPEYGGACTGGVGTPLQK